VELGLGCLALRRADSGVQRSKATTPLAARRRGGTYSLLPDGAAEPTPLLVRGESCIRRNWLASLHRGLCLFWPHDGSRRGPLHERVSEKARSCTASAPSVPCSATAQPRAEPERANSPAPGEGCPHPPDWRAHRCRLERAGRRHGGCLSARRSGGRTPPGRPPARDRGPVRLFLEVDDLAIGLAAAGDVVAAEDLGGCHRGALLEGLASTRLDPDGDLPVRACVLTLP
jgi:hypothetical protein